MCPYIKVSKQHNGMHIKLAVTRQFARGRHRLQSEQYLRSAEKSSIGIARGRRILFTTAYWGASQGMSPILLMRSPRRVATRALMMMRSTTEMVCVSAYICTPHISTLVATMSAVILASYYRSMAWFYPLSPRPIFVFSDLRLSDEAHEQQSIEHASSAAALSRDSRYQHPKLPNIAH